jgi:hypothetical protein
MDWDETRMEMTNIYNKDLYSDEEELLIETVINYYHNVQWKICKECHRDFPLHTAFFAREKRQQDGYENKCKKCRKGKFAKIKFLDNNKNLITKDEPLTIFEEYENYLITNILPYRRFLRDNHIEILKYIIEDKLKMSDDEILSITRNWIQKYRLYGVSIHLYQGSTIKMIEAVYPNRFKPWNFITSGTDYWKDNNNIRHALEWFVNQILNDNIISCIEEIPEKVNNNVFKKYDLGGFVNKCFGHSYYAFEYLYPGKFFEWEYEFVPDNYWSNIENRHKALKQLISQRLSITIEQIPKVLSFMFFNLNPKYHKFITVLEQYYDLNLYSYVNECYPFTFTLDQFPSKNHYETLDNIVVKSEPERMIHHLLIKNQINAMYEPKHKYRLFNEYDCEYYTPDWAIENNGNVIIIEYYGMLGMNDIDFGYSEKYLRKSEFYKRLCDDDKTYIYVELIQEDLKNNFEGLKRKFKDIDITINN